ncbi:hypothetical protein [Budvicia diplopodorum]|uniref:hypothetical protein n=1 Tax=Budvicia diplopodorum TaxID=1119056 RepID=UPI00135ADC0C|nr:hypothetical protein [Budvicia diplopodorum]
MRIFGLFSLTVTPLFLLAACTSVPKLPTVAEADSAIKSTLLNDAQAHDSAFAVDMVKADIGCIRVKQLENCHVQQGQMVVCDVYSDFRIPESGAVETNLDKIGFEWVDDRWVANLFK